MSSVIRKTRLAYLVSHPIQYQAPLLKQIAAEPDIELTVYFCSDYSIREHKDKGFGKVIQWDVPLLEGYRHVFLPERIAKGAPTAFRPINSGLSKFLKEGNFDVLWVHGYMRFYHLIAMIIARKQGRIVLNRDESWDHSAVRGPVKKYVKRLLFILLRQICHGWLAIGSANRDYYLANGMKNETIFSMPYSVDNDRFTARASDAAKTRDELRLELNLDPGRPIVLYASKFMNRKQPHDLIDAFAQVLKMPDARRPYLIMVGDGEQNHALRKKVLQLNINDSVRFSGFQNQTKIPRFYDLCDVFVLPSTSEPWGLAVNEVMCAGRAVIVSDQVGAAADLVRDGENGYIFPAKNIEALAQSLEQVLSDPERCRLMGIRSRAIIELWSFREDIAGLKLALKYFLAERTI